MSTIKKESELPTVNTIANADFIRVVSSGGISRAITWDNLSNLIPIPEIPLDLFQAVVQVDGVIGTDCDFNSLQAAADSGAKSIFFKGSTVYEGICQGASVGGLAFMAILGEPFNDGDFISVISEADPSGRRIEGVFEVADVQETGFNITLYSNGATGGYGGGITTGAATKFHLVDSNGFSVSDGTLNNISIVGESPANCTLFHPTQSTLLITSVTLDGFNIKNFRIATAHGGRAIELVGTGFLELKNSSFFKIVFGYEYNIINGPVPYSLSYANLGKMSRVDFLSCTIQGHTTYSYLFLFNRSLAESYYNIRFINNIFLEINHRIFYLGSGSGFITVKGNQAIKIYADFLDSGGSPPCVGHQVTFNQIAYGSESQFKDGGTISSMDISTGTKNIVIEGNSIYALNGVKPGNCLKLNYGGVGDAVSQGNIIANNTFVGFTTYAIYLLNCKNSQITGNSLKDGPTGIHVGGGVQYSVVKNNVMQDITTAISGSGGTGTVIADNPLTP